MRLVSSISCVLLVCAVSACADKGGEGMFILNNTAAPVGTMCVFTGDPTQPFIAAGEISYDSLSGYFFSPLIESRITAVTGQEAERTIHLEGADVTLSVANGAAGTPFTALFSGSVAPNGGTTNIGFELMSKSAMTALGAGGTQNVEVVANIAIYGTLGGGRIDGEPFQYPITIIASRAGIENSIGSCASTTLPAVVHTGNPCNPFQDGEIDCCTCKTSTTASTLVCPSLADSVNCM
jgi:hypothetical protein